MTKDPGLGVIYPKVTPQLQEQDGNFNSRLDTGALEHQLGLNRAVLGPFKCFWCDIGAKKTYPA